MQPVTREFESLWEIAAAIGGSAWDKGDKRRIYFDMGEDYSAYFEMDPDSDDFYIKDGVVVGAELKVWCNLEIAKFAKIQKCKQKKFMLLKDLNKLIGTEVCEKWEDVKL